MASATRSAARTERLQKILAAAGIASRRACEELIREGRVSVNGRRAELGQSACAERDAVAVKPIRRERLQYWVVCKPRGVLTTVSDPRGRTTIVELLPKRSARLFPVGRLDRDTEGLVLLTNDGELAHRLLHPSFEQPREYRVTVRGRVLAETLRQIERGVALDDVTTAPARVGQSRYDVNRQTTRFALTLIEGRKRQIRRMLQALGHPVVRLLRVRMGSLRLGSLEPGESRPLTDAERRGLLRVAGVSRRQSPAKRSRGRK